MRVGTVKSYAGATGGDLHIDTPLSNISIGYRPRGLIARDVYPLVRVDKQSDAYYVWDRDEWLRTPSAQRAKGTQPRGVQLKVSSATFYCLNYALEVEIPFEDMSNADAALNLRISGANRIVDGLEQDWERRLATTLTTTTNMGSSTALTNNWADHVNGAPVEDISVGMESIRSLTGYDPNVLILSGQAYRRAARHPDLIAFVRGTGDNIGGGFATPEQIGRAFGIDKVLVGRGTRNTAGEDAPGNYVDIWSTSAILLYVTQNPGLMEPTHGYTFWWPPEGFPGRFGVETDVDRRKHVHWMQTHTFQDERVTSAPLGYLIVGT